MSEIEEIKERWFPLGFVGDSQDQKDVQFLFSSLEKVQEEISELKGQIKVEIENNQGWVADLGKEKERVKELSDEKLNRHEEVMMWVEKCNKAEERIKKLEIVDTKHGIKLVDRLEEAEERVKELGVEVQKWQRIRTPTHGPCCTCQVCGQHYDDCRCDLDEVGDELEQTKSNFQKLVGDIKQLLIAYENQISYAFQKDVEKVLEEVSPLE